MQEQNLQMGGWKTIQEVCTALSLPQDSYEAIRLILKSAHEYHQGWVKKDPDTHYWLINTEHPSYHLLTHILTGDTDQADPVTQEIPLDLIAFSGPLPPLHRGPRCEPERLPFSVITDWPQLCNWLSERGVSVALDFLYPSDDACWQWQWGDVRGNGCESAEEAMLSAIAARLAYLEQCVASQADKPRRKRFFFF